MGLHVFKRPYSEEEDAEFAVPSVPQRRRGFKLLPILLFAVAALIYYYSNQEVVPLTGRKHLVGMSEATELQLGLQSYAQVLNQSDVVLSGAEVDLIRSVGSKIAAASENEKYDWEFNLINSPEVNAFCLPGGKVAVYSGMLSVAQSRDGLAVVLGHEVAHAIARHGAERAAHQQIAQFGQIAMGMAVGEMEPEQQRALMGAFGLGAQFGVMLPFSRKHESEADYMGLIFMARACYNPEEAPRFWERMAESAQAGAPREFMSTHPSHETRVAQLKQWMPEALAVRAKYCQR